MCGIVGYVDLHASGASQVIVHSKTLIKQMSSAIAHRGPDAEGYHFDEDVVLGNRRLSIVDLSRHGNQPMYNETNDIAIIFNGEIYNYKELRLELEAKHQFRSQSDTEVLVHAYEEWSIDSLERLNGDFAICIWDMKKRELFLAVDRFGVKHLYFSMDDNYFVFGSEVKCMLLHPSVEKSINKDALNFFLVFGYLPDKLSMFGRLRRVPAGCYVRLCLDLRSISEHRYYKGEIVPGIAGVEDASEQQLVGKFRKSIERRLSGDVPVGLFLSSGVDSSSILAFMRELYPHSIHTFTIGFIPDNNRDELSNAREFALRMGAIFHPVECTLDGLALALLETSRFVDEPIADVSILPTFLVSRETRKFVKVALSGDGADELFGGYETYSLDKFMLRHHTVTAALSPLLAMAQKLPETKSDVNLLFALKQFRRSENADPMVRHFLLKSAFSPGELRKLLVDQLVSDEEQIYEPIKEYEAMFLHGDFLDRLLKVDRYISLQSDMLMKVDVASMANSLEVRVPYLDHEFVEAVDAIPADRRIRYTGLKLLWKKILSKYLPGSIVGRKKLGFGIPVKLLLNRLRPVVEVLLGEEVIKRQGIFRPEYVKEIVKNHYLKGHNQRKKIWVLLAFQLWYFNFVDKSIDLDALFSPYRRAVVASDEKFTSNSASSAECIIASPVFCTSSSGSRSG